MLSPLVWTSLSALAVLALLSVRRIPEGQAYTLRRLDGRIRLLQSGTHWVVPLVERVAHKISLTGSTLAFEDAASNGQRLRGAVYFQVLDPQRADAVIEQVDDLLRDRTCALLHQPALPDDLSERRAWLKQSLNRELRDQGLLVTRIELADAA
jgi:regulator of protease activity HflC (stomatin/prohibitin superfamily)